MAVNTNTTSSREGAHSSPAQGVAEVSSAGELLDDLLDAEETSTDPKGKQGGKPERETNDADEDSEDELEGEDADDIIEDDDQAEDELEDDAEEDEDAEDTDEETPADELEDEKDDDELADLPKGMEKLAASKEFKWAAKRLARFTKEVRGKNELIAHLNSRALPGVEHPFADIIASDDLKTAVAGAKQVLADFGKLAPEDFVEDKETGEMVYPHREGKVTVHLTREEIEKKLALARRQTDPEAITARQAFIAQRLAMKPWEVAETIAPGMGQPGTWEHGVFQEIMSLAPSLRAELPFYEEILARAIAHKQREQLMQPSKEFPKGRLKVVEYKLDAKGNVIPPKRAGNKPAVALKTAKQKVPPTSTHTSRPNLRPDPKARKSALTTASRNGQAVDADAWLDAEDA